jgi:hypothetical protein
MNQVRSFLGGICSASSRRRLPVALLLVAPLVALAHPDKIEDRLLFHFATGTHPIENGTWPDLTHRLTAKLIGEPALTNIGPAQAIVFNGLSDWLLAAPDIASAQAALPKKEFSVAAWVFLNELQPEGGIAGLLQDNGDYEKGWLLGYDRKRFTFTVSSTGADDGTGKMTVLPGKTDVEVGRWHHVVGTYDGATMRLYLDGKLESEST